MFETFTIWEGRGEKRDKADPPGPGIPTVCFAVVLTLSKDMKVPLKTSCYLPSFLFPPALVCSAPSLLAYQAQSFLL